MLGFLNGLRTIERFGPNIQLDNNGYHFYNCYNLTRVSLIDAPINPIDNSYSHTFYNADGFTGEGLNNWNTGSITNMESTFESISNVTFGFDLRLWNLSSVTNMRDILLYSSYSTTNYSNLLIYLHDNTTTPNVPLRVGSTYFNQASVVNARNSLLARGWTITDNGAV